MKHTFNISIILEPFQKSGSIKLGELEPSDISDLSLYYRTDEEVSLILFNKDSGVRIIPKSDKIASDILLDSLSPSEKKSLLEEIVKRGLLAPV